MFLFVVCLLQVGIRIELGYDCLRGVGLEGFSGLRVSSVARGGMRFSV